MTRCCTTRGTHRGYDSRLIGSVLCVGVVVIVISYIGNISNFNVQTVIFNAARVHSLTTASIHDMAAGSVTQHHATFIKSISLWGIQQTDIKEIFKNTKKAHFLKDYKNPCWFQHGHDWSGFRCLPYLYLLGVAKSGTSSLFREMVKHPDIEEPPKKELFFWNSLTRKNLTNYTKLFTEPALHIYRQKNADGYHQKVTFEATPAYFTNHGDLSRVSDNIVNGEYRYTLAHVLYSLNPQTKLIVTLRNPTDRLYSHYHHFHFRGFSPEDFHQHVVSGVRMMNKCLARKSLRMCAFDYHLNQVIRQGNRIMLHYSMYYPYAKEWLDVFPRDQILFIKAEEYYANKSAVMEGVFKFIGLGQLPRNDRTQVTIQEVPVSNKTNNPQRRRVSEMISQHRYRGSMLNETRQILDDFFQPFNKQLAQLLGDDKWLFSEDI